MLASPKMLYLIIPFFLFIVIIITRAFVKRDGNSTSDIRYQRRKIPYRILMILSRTIIITLLIIALAGPYKDITKELQGDPKVHILWDQSTSMDLYDTSFVNTLEKELSKRMDTEVSIIAAGEHSPLKQAILLNTKKFENLLIISDFQDSTGENILELTEKAISLNTTISYIDLSSEMRDAAVTIEGPTKVWEESPTRYRVKVNTFNMNAYELTFSVDEEILLDGFYDQEWFDFELNFTKGNHRLMARISTPDHFSENNIYFKAVRTTEKPLVLLISKKTTPLLELLQQFYDVEHMASLPASLDSYYAVVLEDMPYKDIGDVNKLAQYLEESNGLFVIGGFHSFDYGDYKNSALETLLPVTIGAAKKKSHNANIVISLDRSSSFQSVVSRERRVNEETGEIYWVDVEQQGKELNTAKALAVEITKDLNRFNSLGVLAFDVNAYQVSPLVPLLTNKQQIIEKITQLDSGSGTYVHIGLVGAYEMLKGTGGSKNIIYISDGLTSNEQHMHTLRDTARTLGLKGIKVYTVSLGEYYNEELLRDVAMLSGGVYFKASERNRLNVLFGDPDDTADQAFSIFPIRSDHFITKDLDFNDVTLYGYNQVLPKHERYMLFATETGRPALMASHFGVGRVATFNVFQSDGNLGNVLSSENSRILTRTINWLIGDPERKKDFAISYDDAHYQTPLAITLHSVTYPSFEGFNFTSLDEDVYSTVVIPETYGFEQLLGEEIGVNYKKEYEQPGLSERVLNEAFADTGGKVFKPENKEEIISYIIEVSRRSITERDSYRMPFLIAAMCLFFLEAIIRKLLERSG